VLHWSLVRLAHCLLVIALNDVYYFEQINMMMKTMKKVADFVNIWKPGTDDVL